MLKIEITCTKEHLEKALYCGIDDSKLTFPKKGTTSNCWIAIACQDIFPQCVVGTHFIFDKDSINRYIYFWKIRLHPEAIYSIREFDSCETIEEREKLQPFSFVIEIDDNTLDKIIESNGFGTISNFEETIKGTSHLKIINEPELV